MEKYYKHRFLGAFQWEVYGDIVSITYEGHCDYSEHDLSIDEIRHLHEELSRILKATDARSKGGA